MAKQLINREIRYTYGLVIMNGGVGGQIWKGCCHLRPMAVDSIILISQLSLFCTSIDIRILTIVIIW